MTGPLGTAPPPAPTAPAPAGDERPPASPPPAPPSPSEPLPPGSWRGRWPGRLRPPTRSGWITGGIGLLALGLDTWRLSSLGEANAYYTAAVRSASESWKAFLFGSLDPASFITIDKPPAAFWVQALSVRVLGFSSWAMLLPQALAGVASVLLLHRIVRRWAGDAAAHLAALALALTPVAVLMFRYNNPDALLTLLGVAGAWALWNAVETGHTRWLVACGALVGLAFQAKMLQALLVVPAFALVYLVAGPPRLGRRVLQLGAGLAALLASAGWWVAVVSLWPSDSRPFIGGSTDGTALDLIFGYNGFGRIFGGDGNPGGAGGTAGGPGGGFGGGLFGGSPGWSRLFNDAIGGQVAWLVPFALAGLAAGLWLTRRAPRTDGARAGWLLWGGWTLTCAAVFSLAEGIFHPYYTVQLAPGVAALAGAGGPALWRLGRTQRWLRLALPAAVVATAAWAAVLLGRTPDYAPWLTPVVVGGAALAAGALWLAWQLRSRALVVGAGGVAAVALFAGPAAYSLTTVGNAATGAVVSAGPASAGGGTGGLGGLGGPGGGGPGGSAGADEGLLSYLEAHRAGATYLVATFGSQSAAPLIIATGEPVIAMGGFTGSDPWPTLAELQRLVAEGEVRYVLVGGMGGGGFGGGPGGGSGTGAAISEWVAGVGTVIDPGAYGGSTTAGTLYDVAGTA